MRDCTIQLCLEMGIEEERIVTKKHMLSQNDRNAQTKMLVYLVL
jgi:hypothetical protein